MLESAVHINQKSRHRVPEPSIISFGHSAASRIDKEVSKKFAYTTQVLSKKAL